MDRTGPSVTMQHINRNRLTNASLNTQYLNEGKEAMMVVILVTFAAILFFYFRYFLNSKYKHFGSPGPCLPLIGHSYVMMTKEAKKDPAQRIWSLYKKHQKHGMLYFKSIGLNQLLIGDFEAIKYIFNHSDGNGRINDQISRFTKITRKVQKCKDFPGLIMSEGETWKQQRRFSLRTLRDFGFGKQGLEELIMDEVKMFKHLLDTEVGQPIDIATKLNLPILNALWKVTVGERFDYDDPRLLDICQRLTETFKLFVGTKLALNSYPWMRRLFSKWLSTDFILQSLHDVIDLMKENIVKHQQTLDVNSPRDYTDMVLKEIENTTDESSSFHGSVGLDNLKVALFDLFLAGSETTSTTLTWASLYMVRYPEVQARVQPGWWGRTGAPPWRTGRGCPTPRRSSWRCRGTPTSCLWGCGTASPGTWRSAGSWSPPAPWSCPSWQRSSRATTGGTGRSSDPSASWTRLGS